MTGPIDWLFYTPKTMEDIANAGGCDFDDLRTKFLLCRGLHVAGQWFRMSQGGKDLVPGPELVKALERLSAAAIRVAMHARAMTSKTEDGGPATTLSRPSPSRYAERLSKLNDMLSEGEDEDHDAFLDGALANALSHRDAGGIERLSALRGTLTNPTSSFDEIAAAANDLALRAAYSAKRMDWMRSNMIRPGHSGHVAMNGWIGDMLNLYAKVSGRIVGTSVGSQGRDNQGEAEGPLIRFLMAAFAPVQTWMRQSNTTARAAGGKPPFDDNLLRMGTDAWRSRIRTAQLWRKKALEGGVAKQDASDPEAARTSSP